MYERSQELSTSSWEHVFLLANLKFLKQFATEKNYYFHYLSIIHHLFHNFFNLKHIDSNFLKRSFASADMNLKEKGKSGSQEGHWAFGQFNEKGRKGKVTMVMLDNTI